MCGFGGATPPASDAKRAPVDPPVSDREAVDVALFFFHCGDDR